MMPASSGSKGEQGYAPGYEPGITDLFRFRSAERFARHLLAHLRPGMHVLDCGCGPGTITVGLASRVAPGDGVGIDRDAKQIAAAITAAQEAGVPNVRFEAGDILHLSRKHPETLGKRKLGVGKCFVLLDIQPRLSYIQVTFGKF